MADLRLIAAIKGDLQRMLADDRRRLARAARNAAQAAADGVKSELRAAIAGAGLGTRLGRAIESKVYPGRPSLGAAGVVRPRSRSAEKLLIAFGEGVTIRSAHGLFLAIPTELAGKYAGVGRARKRITPAGWEQATGLKLRFVYRRGAPSLLVADAVVMAKRGNRVRRASARRLRQGRDVLTAVIFILVPQVALRKRFDLAGIAQRGHGLFYAALARELDREGSR